MSEKLSDKQAISMVFLSILGSSVVLGTAREAKSDSWISIILALIISLFITFCYARLYTSFYGKNLFEICLFVFGKVFGRIIIILFIWYALFINALILRDLGEFIYIIGVIDIRGISQIFTMGILMVLCIYMAKKGLIVFGRFSAFFLPIIVIMIGLGYLLSINNMSPRNLLPIMFEGIKPIFDGMLSSINFPFTECIVFIMIFGSLQTRTSAYKVLFRGVLFAGILLLIITLFDIMILGANTFHASYFPSYASLRRISVGNFLERIEITIILSFIFSVFCKSTCYLIAVCKGIAVLFNIKEYKYISAPIGFLVVCIAYLLYENIKEFTEYAKIDTYTGITFQILLFFVVFIGGEIKSRKKKIIKH